MTCLGGMSWLPAQEAINAEWEATTSVRSNQYPEVTLQHYIRATGCQGLELFCCQHEAAYLPAYDVIQPLTRAHNAGKA
jgi:hypothetical protein